MSISEKDVLNLLQQNKNSDKNFAEFVAELFKDKFVEIYLGDNYQVAKLEQTETYISSVICGKVIGAFKDCLILNSVQIKGGQLVLGNIVFVNEINIKTLTEVDNNGSVNSAFMSSKQAQKIKDIINE